jgi:hypothetical protein
MARIDDWYERRRESPAGFVSEAAGDRFWRHRRRFIAAHPDLSTDLAEVLFPAPLEIIHALTLVLSRLPEQERYGFAEAFFDVRGDAGRTVPVTAAGRLRAAAKATI